MNQITLLILYLVIANVFAWFQIQGQFLGGKLGQWLNNDIIVVLLGIPIGWLLWKAASLSYLIFGGVWNIRMIGFGLGTVIFGIMTWLILNELPAWHTIISIILAVAIILLQFSNLNIKV
tara:strand:+ start:395 stop:754 length:360 start_codon:yes stop_codon:yes gene_type:complete